MLFTSSALLVASAFVQQSLAAQVQGAIKVDGKFVGLSGPFQTNRYFVPSVASATPQGIYNLTLAANTTRCSNTTVLNIKSNYIPGDPFQVESGHYVVVGDNGGELGFTGDFNINCDTTVTLPQSFPAGNHFASGYGSLAVVPIDQGGATANVTFVPTDPASRCFYSADPYAATCSTTYAPLTCNSGFSVNNGVCSCAAGTYRHNDACVPCIDSQASVCDQSTGVSLQCINNLVLNSTMPVAHQCGCNSARQYANSKQTCASCPDVRAQTCSSPAGTSTSCQSTFLLNSSNTCVCKDGQYASASMASCVDCPSKNAATCDSNGTLTSCKPIAQLDPTSPDYASCGAAGVGSTLGSILRPAALPARMGRW